MAGAFVKRLNQALPFLLLILTVVNLALFFQLRQEQAKTRVAVEKLASERYRDRQSLGQASGSVDKIEARVDELQAWSVSQFRGFGDIILEVAANRPSGGSVTFQDSGLSREIDNLEWKQTEQQWELDKQRRALEQQKLDAELADDYEWTGPNVGKPDSFIDTLP